MSLQTVEPVTEAPEGAVERMRSAKRASREIARLTSADKARLLEAIAAAIESHSARIIDANAADIAQGRADGIGDALIDRLRLDDARVAALASAVRDVAVLPDPVGRVIGGHRMPNGVALEQVRVPFGVVGAIYEARPNVTVDIAALALRAGNAIVLRGGSAAKESNTVLVEVMREALVSAGGGAVPVRVWSKLAASSMPCSTCQAAAWAWLLRRSSAVRPISCHLLWFTWRSGDTSEMFTTS